MPAPRIRRLGPAQRADQGGGLRFAERIGFRGSPVQPQQQTRKVQDEVNQAHVNSELRIQNVELFGIRNS